MPRIERKSSVPGDIGKAELGRAVNDLIVAKHEPGSPKHEQAMQKLTGLLASEPGTLEELLRLQNGK